MSRSQKLNNSQEFLHYAYLLMEFFLKTCFDSRIMLDILKIFKYLDFYQSFLYKKGFSSEFSIKEFCINHGKLTLHIDLNLGKFVTFITTRPNINDTSNAKRYYKIY